MNIHELRKCVADYCRDQVGQQQFPKWWRDPLLVTADADERFKELPEIAATNHMLPNDLLLSCQTVVVFFIPFSDTLSNGNIEGKFPSDGWGVSLPEMRDELEVCGKCVSGMPCDLQVPC